MSKCEINVPSKLEVDNRTSIEQSATQLAIALTMLEENIGSLAGRLEPLMAAQYPEKAEDCGRPVHPAKAVEYLDVQTDRIRNLSNHINSINNSL